MADARTYMKPNGSLRPPSSKTRTPASDEICVPIKSDRDIILARQNGRDLAARLGFSPTDLTLIATAISELARNIVLYARSGEIVLKPLQKREKRGICVIARDKGPGIGDVARSLQDGYSTSRSLGLGLPGVRRLMDTFEIQSAANQGTTVKAEKWTLPRSV